MLLPTPSAKTEIFVRAARAVARDLNINNFALLAENKHGRQLLINTALTVSLSSVLFIKIN